jgi:hypothetical protein
MRHRWVTRLVLLFAAVFIVACLLFVWARGEGAPAPPPPPAAASAGQ